MLLRKHTKYLHFNEEVMVNFQESLKILRNHLFSMVYFCDDCICFPKKKYFAWVERRYNVSYHFDKRCINILERLVRIFTSKSLQRRLRSWIQTFYISDPNQFNPFHFKDLNRKRMQSHKCFRS